MSCPNNCQAITEIVHVRSSPSYFSNYKSEELQNKKGVVSVASIGHNPVEITLNVDQNEYKTDNHFKHRQSMEQNENINVSDVSEGKVKIRYNGKLVRLAHRCSDCGTVFSPENSDVFDEDSIIDLSHSTNYVATRLI